jgi:hypothetical protein
MDTPDWPDPETLAGFVTERADFFRIGVLETAHGFDVVLRIDGTYAAAGDAEAVVEYLRAWLRDVLPAAARRRWESHERAGEGRDACLRERNMRAATRDLR